jgi:hypothetical protein
MARVTKPCPECGGTESIRDTPTSICRRCQGLIAFAKQRMEDDAKKDRKEVLVMTRERSYALPGWYVDVGDNPDHTIRERLQKALHAVIMAQARPSNIDKYPCPDDVKDALDVPKIPKGYRSHDWVIYMYMRRDQAQAVVELEEAMREYIIAGAAASYEKGQDLLMSIAQGRISMDKLNEAHTKKG